MSFVHPFVLLGLLPLAALAFLLWRQAPMLVPALPGGWARLIEPPLRRFMARDLSRPGLAQVWLCLAIAALLVAAAARPLLPVGDPTDYANMVGRVVVVDADAPDIARRRIAVDRLLAASPRVPTALVALAGDAYLVVPFTTDRAQIDRYLVVLEPDAMPLEGMALHAGLALAEKVIADAGVVAGQIVLFAGDKGPGTLFDVPASETLRTFVVAGDPEVWRAAAERHGADLTPDQDLEPVTSSLSSAIDALRADLPGGAIDIAPWLMALSVLLCLGLFRRRSAM